MREANSFLREAEGQLSNRKRSRQDTADDQDDGASIPQVPQDNVRSLPVLLYLRQTGRWRGNPCTWKQHSVRHESGIWRPFAAEVPSIPFSVLDTPKTEAVLGLDRTGSYMVSLGGSSQSSTEPNLFLRFYGKYMQASALACCFVTRVPGIAAHSFRASDSTGVPSRSRLAGTSRVRREKMCPLLYQIPLWIGDHNSLRDEMSPVATVPVDIVITHDWCIGIALVIHDPGLVSCVVPRFMRYVLPV